MTVHIVFPSSLLYNAANHRFAQHNAPALVALWLRSIRALREPPDCERLRGLPRAFSLAFYETFPRGTYDAAGLLGTGMVANFFGADADSLNTSAGLFASGGYGGDDDDGSEDVLMYADSEEDKVRHTQHRFWGTKRDR